MATWKQEHVMLTKVGERALASAEAGEGKITITRIVGSSYNPSDLYNVSNTTGISGNIVFNVVDRKPVGNTSGTTIVIQATNNNVTAKFRMNTLVVFATQSNISSGEFPYMIAKTLNADEVDLPTITPVTLNFSLTILNTRGGLLNLTISNTGFVPIPTYLIDMQDYQNNVVAFGVTTGSEITQLLNSQFLNDHPITLKDGVSVKVKLGYNLKSNSTLNVAGTGDKPILDVTGNTIPNDTFTQGSMLNLMYDTTRSAWIVTGGEVLTASNGIQKVGKDMQLVNSGVLTKHIKDLNVTTEKLADKSVTYDKLDDSLRTKLDEDYVKKSGDTMTGDLNFSNTKGLSFNNSDNTKKTTICVDTNGNLGVGSHTNTEGVNLCCKNRPEWYAGTDSPNNGALMKLNDISITSGTIKHGQLLPIPTGFTEEECTWILSIEHNNFNNIYFDVSESGSRNMFNIQCWREGRKVHVGTLFKGFDGFSKSYGTDYILYSSNNGNNQLFIEGSANYVCIAVKKS